MNKEEFYVKYDADNRLSLKIPEDELSVDFADFKVLKTKVDKKSKKVYIELSYEEYD